MSGNATWRSQDVIKARAMHPLRQHRDSDHRKVLSYRKEEEEEEEIHYVHTASKGL